MHSIEVAHLVQAYRTHELRRRAEEERRIRRLLATPSVPTERARTMPRWLQAALSSVSWHTTSASVIRSDAAVRSPRGAA